MLKNSKSSQAELVIVSSHVSDLEGPTEALLSYLDAEHIDYVAFLFPLHYCVDRSPRIKTPKKDFKLAGFGLIPSLTLCCARDFLLSLCFSIYAQRRRTIIFVGIDPLNALTGLVLKALGLVERHIYYSIDWTPKRFTNDILNRVYHKLDRICANYSDENWNLSDRINQVRILQSDREKNKIVPVGIPRLFRRLYRSRLTQYVVLLGALAPSKGVDLLIEAWPLVIRALPNARLFVIGKSPENCSEAGVSYLPYEPRLNQLGETVTLLGAIPRVEVYRKLIKMNLGLALYKPESENLSFWADPSRVKDYLCCGLPVLITNVPSIATEIAEKNCGSIVDYDKYDLVQKICLYLTDSDLQRRSSSNAYRYMQNITWKNIFDRGFDIS